MVPLLLLPLQRILHSIGVTTFVLFAVVVTRSVQVMGQSVIGTDICYCQPAVYQLQLNFSLTCADRDITNSTPGIFEAGCLVESRGSVENITDPFPVLVSDIQILELDQNLKIVGQAVYQETYGDGDIISYTSVVITSPNDVNAVTLPRAFQVTLTGINKEEETLTNVWIIKYDNDCGIFPLLTEGQKMGWTVFYKIGDPPQSLCPIAPPPLSSSAPSEAPAKTIGSDAPSANPTFALPSGISTKAPTAVPVPTTTTKAPTTNVLCPPTLSPAGSSSNSIKIPTSSPVKKEKRPKELHDRGHRILRVHSPVASPTDLCIEPDTDVIHKTKKVPKADTSPKIKVKKNKVKEDRQDPSTYNDDVE